MYQVPTRNAQHKTDNRLQSLPTTEARGLEAVHEGLVGASTHLVAYGSGLFDLVGAFFAFALGGIVL